MERIDLLLINPPFHIRSGGGSLFPLGLGYIISAVKKYGYSYKVIDCSEYITSYYPDDLQALGEQLRKELKKYIPLAIGIGPCITTQIKALKIIADNCKEVFNSNAIFAGGPLASIDGQEWVFFEYLGIENIIKGDGELAVIEALSFVKQGKELSHCSKITTRSRTIFNEIKNIDLIAFPTRRFLKNEKISIRRTIKTALNKTASMITSRGCMYNCRYCVSGNIAYIKKFRKRSYKSIIEEMIRLKEEHDIADIIFYDDCFFYNPKNANKDVSAFSTLLRKRNLYMTWQMEIRPDLLMELNQTSLLLLEKYGCRQINIGIEKTSNEGLKYLGKSISLHGLSQKITHIKELTHIQVAGTFILGGADETENNILQIIDDSTKMNLDFAHYNPLFVYPGTPIYNTVFADKKEWVTHILDDSLPWGEIVYENEHVNKEKLVELVNYAYRKFYSSSQYSDSQMVVDRFNLKRGERCDENL